MKLAPDVAPNPRPNISSSSCIALHSEREREIVCIATLFQKRFGTNSCFGRRCFGSFVWWYLLLLFHQFCVMFLYAGELWGNFISFPVDFAGKDAFDLSSKYVGCPIHSSFLFIFSSLDLHISCDKKRFWSRGWIFLHCLKFWISAWGEIVSHVVAYVIVFLLLLFWWLLFCRRWIKLWLRFVCFIGVYIGGFRVCKIWVHCFWFSLSICYFSNWLEPFPFPL